MCHTLISYGEYSQWLVKSLNDCSVLLSKLSKRPYTQTHFVWRKFPPLAVSRTSLLLMLFQYLFSLYSLYKGPEKPWGKNILLCTYVEISLLFQKKGNLNWFNTRHSACLYLVKRSSGTLSCGRLKRSCIFIPLFCGQAFMQSCNNDINFITSFLHHLSGRCELCVCKLFFVCYCWNFVFASILYIKLDKLPLGIYMHFSGTSPTKLLWNFPATH